MKKHLPSRLLTAGTALFLTTLASFPAWAGEITGHLDMVSSTGITGWAWDEENPDIPLTVELTISSESMGPGGYANVTASADQERADLKQALGFAKHGFTHVIDWSQYQGKTFTVTAAVVTETGKTPLTGTHTFIKEETASEEADMALGPGFTGNADLMSGTSAQEQGSQTGPGDSKTTEFETGEPDEYLGSFLISGYCNCSNCSGGHSRTYSGTIPQADHTISADLNCFPIGTKLLIDGIVYTVEDKGSGVVDNRLDIYFATHADALDFGLQTKDVYSVK